MAFEGGYGGSQRPYAGPAAQPPVPRGGFSGRGPPPRQHNGYQNDYGAGGYEQDYGGQYQDPGYGRGRPPPQGAYGPGPGRGRPPPPPRGGRGGPPMGRPGTADGFHGRGGNYPPRGGMGPPPGRGRPPGPRRGGGGGPPGPNQYPPNIDVAGARHPINSAPVSPQGSNFGDVYQSFQGNQLANQMSAMDLNGQGPRGPPGGGRPGSGGRGIQEDYANPPMSPASRGNSNGYPDPRRGPPGQAVGGYGEYDDGYGPPGHEFGAQRSMTMPFNNGPAGQDVPARPATTTGNRPPPQRTYPPDTQRPPQSYYGGDNYDGNDYDQGSDIYDVYDSYYDDPRASSSDYSSHVRQPSRSSMPDFDAIPLNSKRDSFEQSMRPGAELSQPGAHQTPKLSHAQSMAEMHQPQSAIFEMAGDAPDVPAIPLTQAYQGYDEYDGYDQVPPPRGPSAPPGPVGQPGFGHNPPIIRPGTTVPTNPDSLPAHATPVRPGQMQGSVVNPNVKPPPVRNYGGIPQTGPPGQQQPQPYQNQGSPGPGQQQRGEEPPVTPGELEHLRMLIRNNPDDQTSALQLAKRLIEASDVLLPNLPDPRAKTKARERYLMDAHKILKKLANAQNQDAMFLMADSIGKGLFGADADNKEAFIMYQSAAKLGHAAAAYRTAVCCEIGHEEGGGTRKDPLKAIQWYKRAATLGDPPAMYKVGMILLKGLLGQPKNPREAVGWLKRAAERADTENPHALHELGLLYESAQGNDVIIRDEQYALDLFQQAAELGYKFSQFKLGCAYEYGLLGCPIDARLSIVWYSRAATQEEHQAELALSGWYLTGSEGVLGQSDTEAYLWARKAAVAGLAKAEYAMGYFTEVGIGVPANLEDAKRWYWRAAGFPQS